MNSLGHLLDERAHLSERTKRLNEFVQSQEFSEVPGPQRKLISQQLALQLQLVKVLDSRVNLMDYK